MSTADHNTVRMTLDIPLPWAQALFTVSADLIRADDIGQLAQYLGIPEQCAVALHECCMHLADELHAAGVRGW